MSETPIWVWQLVSFILTIIIVFLVAYIRKKGIPKETLVRVKNILKIAQGFTQECTIPYHCIDASITALAYLTEETSREEALAKLKEVEFRLKEREYKDLIIKLRESI